MCVSEKTNLPQKEVDLKRTTKASLSAFKKSNTFFNTISKAIFVIQQHCQCRNL